MNPADTLATAVMNGFASIPFAIAAVILWIASRWIWTRYFWPPIEDPRMLAERRKP